MATCISHLPSGDITISSSRLFLRGAMESDSESMFKAFSDPEAMRYWGTLPHATLSRTSEWLSKMIASPSNGKIDFIICIKPDLVPIGKMGVWQGHEIGFLLAREYWRKGIGQEALGALLPYFFSSEEQGGVGLTRIMADTDPRNEASIGLLKRFGFDVTGFEEKTFEIDGNWVDSIYLELSRDGWQGRFSRHTQR